ncbi:hypothetical protein [Microvirga terricola]|uniref:DUF2845 domain-containing protein n=1 Tax=Microvirga terricola TaxID=2719797 RepID=A0ABX0VEY5_9HYPH|nr:hypothetical protein [Microvirga terricola]NIX77734.1 hypothetical protein [Microvirga terricola]
MTKLLPVVALLLMGTGSAVAKECRMPDLPPGVRVQVPPECKDVVKTKSTQGERTDYVKANQGFIDVGNGTAVKVGGRVRVDYGVRR